MDILERKAWCEWKIIRNATTRMIYIYIFFLFVFPPVRLLPFTYSNPLFPFLSLFPPEVPPLRMWPQLFSLMLYRICTRAQENCGKPVPIQVCPQSTVSEKITSRSAFRYADRRSTIQVLTQCQAAWLVWPPGTGHLSHTERCPLQKWCKVNAPVAGQVPVAGQSPLF